jgi:uncharacterized membrane protein
MDESNPLPDASKWAVTLTPHRSLSRNAFVTLMIILVALNLAGGIMFIAIGAWPVMGFMGLDVAIAWWAFRRNFADADRSERIVIEGEQVTLTRQIKSSKPNISTFNRRWLRVELEYDEPRELVGRLLLFSHGKRTEIASFLGAEERQSLAKALRQALAK